jgi:hypothetical protein
MISWLVGGWVVVVGFLFFSCTVESSTAVSAWSDAHLA